MALNEEALDKLMKGYEKTGANGVRLVRGA